MNRYYANIVMLAEPSDPKHLINKEYAEKMLSRKIKDPVVAVATEDLDCAYSTADKSLTQNTPAAFVVDGVALAEGDRVLVAGQTDATQNGIYVVNTNGDDAASTAGVLVRAADFDEDAKISPNVMIPIMRGVKNGDVTWQMVNDAYPALDTDPITFGHMKAGTNTRTYTDTVTGDGSGKELTVTHNLGTESVQVSVKDAVTGNICIFDVEITDENTVTLKADIVLEATDSFIVTVLG